MEKLRKVWIVVVVLLVGGVAIAEKPPAPTPPPAATTAPPISREATLKDIEKTVGFVPAFFRDVPAAMLPGFWELMKSFQMSTTTRLDVRTKELIGLAVASQIPCDYCIQFHREAAKKAGANDQDIQEAIGMAAMTRMASTVLNGTQPDRAQFKRDLDRIVKPNNGRQTRR